MEEQEQHQQEEQTSHEEQNSNQTSHEEQKENITSSDDKEDIDNLGLEDYEEEEQEQHQRQQQHQRNNNFNANQLTPEKIVQIVANATATFVPKEKQQEYVNLYANISLPLLKLVNIDDLTAKADLSDLPTPIRIIIILVALSAPAFIGINMMKE